jgi:hypothetical protein
VCKRKLGGDPDFFSVMVLFAFSDFLHEMGCIEFLKLSSATIRVFQIKDRADFVLTFLGMGLDCESRAAREAQ